MNRQRRLISLFLIVSILLSTLYLPGGARAVSASKETSLPSSASVSEGTVSSSAHSAVGVPVDLTEEAVLKYINQDAFLASNHTLRLTSEESLNTYVYLNQDGSKTVYIMDENVKYVDAQGKIQNKDVSLVTAKNGYTVTNGMKWKIEETSSGAYKLMPLSGLQNGYVLATTTSDATNGAKLIQGAYVYNNSYRDEWILVPQKTMYYVHYYDSTLASDNSTIGYFDNVTHFSSLVFGELLGYEYLVSGMPSQYTAAVADTCSHASNVPCTSACGTDCSTQHHKNCLRISNQLYADGCQANHTYVLWTNRSSNTYCHEENGVHTPVSWLAVVYGSRPIIHFLRVLSENKEACMGITLVHETAHTLGLPDVYDNVGHDVEDAYVCVMEKYEAKHAKTFYEDILSGTKSAFCDSCQQMLQSLI